MIQLSHASTALLRRSLALPCRTPQVFGSCFQHAVAAALNRIDGYQGCYVNPAAGQPDVIAGHTGIEVKSSVTAEIALGDNYQNIRPQYDQFRLIGLRTDLFLLWALEIPNPVPPQVILGAELAPNLKSDVQLENDLKRELNWVLETAGTVWSDAATPTDAQDALKRLVAPG